MLWWRSFVGWGDKLVACFFGYNADQYSYFGRMCWCSPLIAECVRLRIVDTPLTLHWCCIDVYFQDIEAKSVQGFLPREAADSVITYQYSHTVLRLSMVQGHKLMMICRCSFSGWGNEFVTCILTYNVNHYFYCGWTWQCSRLISECVRLIIVYAQLTVTWNTSKHSSYSQ